MSERNYYFNLGKDERVHKFYETCDIISDWKIYGFCF